MDNHTKFCTPYTLQSPEKSTFIRPRPIDLFNLQNISFSGNNSCL